MSVQAAILYNIKRRHAKKLPYTRTGDMVVAVNPYQWIDTLYTEKQRNQYAQKLVWENSETDPREYLAPHVYETSALSYKGMAFEGGMSQSILVSGESGAGKTETVKICLNHIASVQEGPKAGGTHGTSLVVQRILDSNPLLEAFGNAKTRRNDNSSRFGKYLQLQFAHAGERGRPVAKLAGSKSEVFLLEKNRVIHHDNGERTYHIFYQILAAPDDVKARIWSGLKGTKNGSFKYVGSTDTNTIEGITDAEQFKKTQEVLQLCGLQDSQVTKFMRAICIVLQLGNISFGPLGGDSDKSTITSSNELNALADLMGIADKDLILALTERTMKTRDETLKVPLSPDVAKESTDALAKEIYGKIFLWVVKAINAGTTAKEEAGSKFGIIGLLDIFGFESFSINRFEQLCINYANEKLQQKFTEDIFKSVLAEYEYEGIPLSDIKYDDNTDVLDLIESRGGLCALLNEECVRPKGSGEGFVNKALTAHKKSPCLVANKTDRLSFGIVHYAGQVMYEASNFVVANADTLPTDLEDCATKCSNSIISDAFNYEKYHAAAASSGKGAKRQKSNIIAPTVWTKYKSQLTNLMTNLYATHSRYIRCIKPNTQKKPLLMEHKTSVEQLRYAGIVAGVTISRSAFPNRLSNSIVYARYNNMWDRNKFPAAKSGGMTVPEKVRADCDAVMTCALKPKETTDKDGKVVKAFVVGKTRTYFRAGALEYLESNRITGLDAQATAIQKVARGWLVRRELVFTPRIKQEEEEAARRAEEERLERLRLEQQELNAKANEEIAAMKKEEKALLRELEREDEKAQKALEDFNQQAELVEAERDDLDKRLKELSDGTEATKMEQERLNYKVDANTKVIEALRKENKKLVKALEKNETIYKELSKNNKKLSDNLNMDTSVEGELEYASTVNDRLLESRTGAVDENAHLKDSVQKEQMKYMAIAESRLELQRTLAYILNTIQDKCADSSLMSDAFAIAHQCEAEAKSIMAALDAATS